MVQKSKTILKEYIGDYVRYKRIVDNSIEFRWNIDPRWRIWATHLDGPYGVPYSVYDIYHYSTRFEYLTEDEFALDILKHGKQV